MIWRLGLVVVLGWLLGFVWFAGWYWLLSNAVKAGTLSGPYVGWMVAWNAIMAISAARRQGGLYQVATNVDVDVVSSVLPRDQKASLRNFVGIQALGWAISGLFFSSALTSTLGALAHTAHAHSHPPSRPARTAHSPLAPPSLHRPRVDEDDLRLDRQRPGAVGVPLGL